MNTQAKPTAKILMVDDRPENLLALEAILSDLGEELVRAASGAEALRRVLSDDFALILMDVVMPDMDGFETAELIRQREKSRHTPIIFLTANKRGVTQSFRGYTVGAVDYMVKPLVPEVLTSKVGVFVDLYKNRQEVKRAEEELRRAHDELEKRVQERTAELAYANAALKAEIAGRERIEEERLKLLLSEQRARLEAERVNRTKDEFLATLSHELRTPLNAILGWTHILGLGKTDQETIQRAITVIKNNAQAQSRLIGDILDVSRIIGGKLRLSVGPVHLPAVLESAVDAVRPAAHAKEIKIGVEMPPSPGPFYGDADRLQQVVWNLLSNAIKFTPKGGQVYLSLRNLNGDVEITVRDTGAGISPEFLPYVFDRFTQADSSATRTHGGLGLGLAIVRYLVELHGGTVRAESSGEGRGATFIVTLPLKSRVAPSAQAEVETRTPAVEAANEDLPSLDGTHVLLVDDRAEAREIMTLMLKEYGASVTAVGSAREAIEALPEVKPDVLVSDIAMPGEDGYALISRVRALDPAQGGKIPAVAVSAYALARDAGKALAAGFQCHVAKPVRPAELINAVAGLVAATRNP